MGKRASPVVPKKGKLRSVQKRPAVNKNKAWLTTSLHPGKLAVTSRGQRKDQIKWARNLPELLLASNKKIVQIWVTDKILVNWTGKCCPRCEAGTLSDLKLHKPSGQYKHRCSSRGCQAWISPHHLHPLLTDGRGTGAQSLQIQSSMLLLKLLRVSHPSIHILLNVNHKAIEDLEKKLCELRKDFVEKKEREIVFGNLKAWKDVEAESWSLLV